MKKLLQRFIMLTLCIMICSTSVLGHDVTGGDYFSFVNNLGRMSSDGSFEFEIQIRVTSDTFIATSNTITIETSAQVYSSTEDEYFNSTDEKYKYGVSLIKDGVLDTPVDYYHAYSNGRSKSMTFDVKKGSKYYIEIYAVNKNLKTESYYISGEGTASDIKLAK